MNRDDGWWESNLTHDLENSLALGGSTPSQLDPAVGEFLRKVAQIESILAAAAMTYFEPSRADRAAELEALLSYHLSFAVLIDIVPRFTATLSNERRKWVGRQSTSKLTDELHNLRIFRNELAHGQLWWDFAASTSDSPPPLKVHSYSRSMKLKSTEVSADRMKAWVGRAYEACTVVGQIHYWMIEQSDFSEEA